MSNDDSINTLDTDNSDTDSNLDDEDQRTIFCANFTSDVTEELLYELFLQAGPIDRVQIPKESDGKRNKCYAFIVYEHKCTVPYALKLFEGVKLFNRILDIKSRKIKRKNVSNQNNIEQNSYQSLIINQPISNLPLNMIILDPRFNNTRFNYLNQEFNNFNLGLFNSNINLNTFDLYNNFNPTFNQLNPGLVQLNQELTDLHQGLVHLNHYY